MCYILAISITKVFDKRRKILFYAYFYFGNDICLNRDICLNQKTLKKNYAKHTLFINTMTDIPKKCKTKMNFDWVVNDL